MPPRPRPIAERFWEKVERHGPDECWPWTGALRANGYGGFWPRKRPHRLAWELTHDEQAGRFYVLHTCDNRICCNPAHLYLGTHADNVRDRVERWRGEHVRGERHGKSKLTQQEVEMIRSDPRPASALAAELPVGVEQVRRVRRGEAWSDA